MINLVRTYNINNQRILPNYKNNTSISFGGLKNPQTKALFVFDLDGTLATASQKQMGDIFEYAKEKNAQVIYATGRTYKEFVKLQNELQQAGVILPNPNYLIANNGQFLYENIDGCLIENIQYQNELQQKTNYNRNIVTKTMYRLSQSDKYKYSDSELASLDNLQEIQESDPDFYNSKISYYEWNPSPNMAEYFLAHDIDTKVLKSEITELLAPYGIQVKFRENHYTKPIMDACQKNILLQSNKLRRHSDGSMTALFLCAADKADGIEFIRKNANVDYQDILMAGNDDNDVPMANLTEKGANFICLNNSSTRLKNYCLQLKDGIFNSCLEGAKAILDGIKYFTE